MAKQSRATRPVPILINSEGGTARSAGKGLADTVEKACKAAGVVAEVHLLPGAEMAEAIDAAVGQPLIIVGGGDGTLRSAASAIVKAGAKTTLGILPLGTHNHLAKQLAIPADLTAAIEVAANGGRRKIDVAEVNDQLFLNNASIGLYPMLVRQREAEQERHGLPKWLANGVAARAVLRRLKHHLLRIEIAGTAQSVRTPLLFVGNNVYSLDGGKVGQRDALDDGELSIFAMASATRLSALWFAARTLVGKADRERDFAALATAPELTVSAHASDLHVALDGELESLQTPLHFKIRPLALDVAVPA
ncbi:MAG: diacylglycerol kinase family protein [Pseudomonadota bacterium]